MSFLLSFSKAGVTGSSSAAVVSLKTVWVLAMPPEEMGRLQRASSAPKRRRSVTPISTSTPAQMLKMMCTRPVRLASALAPTEQTMAVVAQSPI